MAGSIYGGGKRVFRLDFTQIDSRYHYVLFASQAETHIDRKRSTSQPLRSSRTFTFWKSATPN
jgi:hypothetical protein